MSSALDHSPAAPVRFDLFRFGSICFGSVSGSGRLQISKARFVSVRPVRFGFLFLPDYRLQCSTGRAGQERGPGEEAGQSHQPVRREAGPLFIIVIIIIAIIIFVIITITTYYHHYYDYYYKFDEKQADACLKFPRLPITIAIRCKCVVTITSTSNNKYVAVLLLPVGVGVIVRE